MGRLTCFTSRGRGWGRQLLGPRRRRVGVWERGGVAMRRGEGGDLTLLFVELLFDKIELLVEAAMAVKSVFDAIRKFPFTYAYELFCVIRASLA